MKPSTTKLFLTYAFVVALILFGIGFILMPLAINNEKMIVILTLIGGFIIFLIMIHQIIDRYIKPVQSAATVAEELAGGNYKVRAYESYYGDIANLSNALNILARNLQEMKIQEKIQGNQLRTVIDNMESGVMLIDERGYVHLVNRKFLSLFGQSKKDYVGFLYYSVFKQKPIHKVVQEAFLYEKKVKNAFTIEMDIEKRYIEIVGAPIFNEFKTLKGAVLVFHDITDLKRLEQTRKDFVANVSHELKTPITSIKGFAETLLDENLSNVAVQEKFLKIIYKESDRIQSLVHDLLELSKLEKDEMQLQYQRIQISEKINQEIIPIIQHQADKKMIHFNVEIKEQLEIEGDLDRLKQVLINILNNAINYTAKGGSIDFKVKQENNYLVITVKDNGIGIPEDKINRIFERFYRVDKARSRNTGGTGLGLAIVKHIVEAHKGTINVTSELDSGTTFTITLPKIKPFKDK
ncbi:Alkaline phosphatase synthesis sensor protein PhoR [Paraliobacillus sp. PM-2]|uniref:two-component system histidine kinase PnpS n=1 Tax=Paraliobacillus sp. PM-2 TaxID=1462524 RepID=UPI00061B9711|nr:ATP-binding protein [Paraliobacillus sp. PM-2]CQR48108.1 Alkaline phosphatase synthesis sensor protein PhoR [Paraliobacillus sp. PM-2]